jgi:threonylcarbamoyladenosine tRNA methylthiotransferase MtaB
VSSSRRVSFHTLGCRLNRAETALLAEGFRRRGYTVAPHGSEVEVAVLNTCSVTDRADARCRNEIRRIRRRSPEAVVCAVGCYSQAEPETVGALPGVDLVVGTDRKYALASLVEEFLRAACEGTPPAGPDFHVSRRPDNGGFEHEGPGYYPEATRANVKIQDGCDFCCSFCILPRVRGRARSRPYDAILAEGRELAARGHRELVVTGVNIGTWGEGGRTVGDVARGLSEIPDVRRVRISSIEPSTVPEDLLAWMESCEKACRHLHLPLQSADDGVLAAMRRVYSAADVARFVEGALERMPDLGVGTDVIVGFPGETEEAFERTYRFVEATPFTNVHVFSYSDRRRTVAERLEPKVPARGVKERSRRMRDLARRKKGEFYARQIGREAEVLFETVDEDGLRKGWTGSYVRVAVEPDLAAENEIVRMALDEVSGDCCRGRIVETATGTR